MFGFQERLQELSQASSVTADLDVSIQVGPDDALNRATWVTLVGTHRGGQVTVWDSGECEVEVYDRISLIPVLLKHVDLQGVDELSAVFQKVAELCRSGMDNEKGHTFC